MKTKGKVIVVVVLAVLGIFTSFIVSQTYAKYISAVDVTDEARTAKWGINVEFITVDLFKDSYIDEEKGYSYVQSSTGCKEVLIDEKDPSKGTKQVCDKVIAPGTSGEYKFKITGRAETNSRIRVEFLDGCIDTVGRIKYTFDHNSLTETYDIYELMDLIEASFGPNGDVYAANTLFDEENNTHTISWVWEFEENACDGGSCNTTDVDRAQGVGIDYDGNESSSIKPEVKLSLRVYSEQTTAPANK